jgi:hypothetical protein
MIFINSRPKCRRVSCQLRMCIGYGIDRFGHALGHKVMDHVAGALD